MYRLQPYIIFSVIVGLFLNACAGSNNPLHKMVADNAILDADISKHELQILYTRIDRDRLGVPQFTEWDYGLDASNYFYPASTAKLPIAVLALQKLNALQADGILIDKDTPFHIVDPQKQQHIIRRDSSSQNGFVTVAHLIKKIFLVSDNDAYNYLFDFLGRDYINSELQKKGLTNTEIHHKFLYRADNSRTWEYTFFNESDTLYRQSSITSKWDQNHAHLNRVLKGKGYMSNDSLVAQPMDFSQKNRISICDLNGILKRVLFPEVFPLEKQFQLTAEDYSFLHFWMSRNALESNYPNYAADPNYWDSYNKFFMYGDRKGQMSDAIRIYNKVGSAYGTLTDVAYIKEAQTGVEFMLTATLLVNENGIFNDDQYEYDAVGIPFLAALGNAVYAYDKQTR